MGARLKVIVPLQPAGLQGFLPPWCQADSVVQDARFPADHQGQGVKVGAQSLNLLQA